MSQTETLEKASAPIQQPVVMNVSISLQPHEIEFVEKAKGIDKLGGIAMYFIQQWIAGGRMLKATEVAELNGLIDGGIVNTDALLAFVRERAGQSRGQMSFIVEIDPSLQEPLEEQARICGVPMEQLVENCINEVCVNGWCLSLEARGGMFFLKPEQRPEFDKIMGTSDWDVQDVLNKLKTLTAAKADAAPIAPASQVAIEKPAEGKKK